MIDFTGPENIITLLLSPRLKQWKINEIDDVFLKFLFLMHSKSHIEQEKIKIVNKLKYFND